MLIESSHEHVDTYKISFLFNKPLKSYGSLYFRIFSMNKSKYHTFANFGTMQVKLIEPIFKRPCTTFHNVIATSSALQKWRAAQILTTFNKLSLQHLMNH